MQGLTVGRVVHYVSYGTPKGEYPSGLHRAAIVTDVWTQGPDGPVSTKVGLCVLNPTGLLFVQAEYDGDNKEPGTWHWIEQA